MNDRVDFVCARADHQGPEPEDALTMHEERWAYCPSAARDAHEWRPVPAGGLSVDDVKRFLGGLRTGGEASA